MLVKTFFSLGKSEIPASRMEIEESRRLNEDRREETEDESVLRAWDWDVYWVFVVFW